MKEQPSKDEAPQHDPVKTLIQIIESHSPKGGSNWSIGIELCKPAVAGESPRRAHGDLHFDDDEEPTNIVGVIEVHPVQGGYGLVYVPTDSTQPGWTLTLNRNGAISNLEGISKEGFLTGLDMIIDHDFPTPSLKKAVIEVSQGEGDFELPEGGGFTGTFVNRNVYVGGVIIHYPESPPTQ